jgi:hypothetical protein
MMDTGADTMDRGPSKPHGFTEAQTACSVNATHKQKRAHAPPREPHTRASPKCW